MPTLRVNWSVNQGPTVQGVYGWLDGKLTDPGVPGCEPVILVDVTAMQYITGNRVVYNPRTNKCVYTDGADVKFQNIINDVTSEAKRYLRENKMSIADPNDCIIEAQVMDQAVKQAAQDIGDDIDAEILREMSWTFNSKGEVMNESHVKKGVEYRTITSDVDRRELTVNIVELTSHVSIGVFVDDVGFQLSINGAEQMMDGLKKVLDYWEMRKKDGV